MVRTPKVSASKDVPHPVPHVSSDTVTVTPAAGASRLPLSSTARHRIVRVPDPSGVVTEFPGRHPPHQLRLPGAPFRSAFGPPFLEPLRCPLLHPLPQHGLRLRPILRIGEVLGLPAVPGPLDDLAAEPLDLVAGRGPEVLVERPPGFELLAVDEHGAGTRDRIAARLEVPWSASRAAFRSAAPLAASTDCRPRRRRLPAGSPPVRPPHRVPSASGCRCAPCGSRRRRV